MSGTKKRGPEGIRWEEGIFFSSKHFLIKVSHFITEHLEHIWFSLLLTLWCLEQKRGPWRHQMPLRVFILFSPRGNIFIFKIFFYKSFPFYNWTFGAYLIFINVNPLVSGTEKGGPEGIQCLRGPILRVNINENQIRNK